MSLETQPHKNILLIENQIGTHKTKCQFMNSIFFFSDFCAPTTMD